MVFTEEERRDMYRWVRVLGIMSAVVVVVVVVVVGDEGGVGWRSVLLVWTVASSVMTSPLSPAAWPAASTRLFV